MICSNCWWLSDSRTRICCNEESEYNLCNVNMDNTCPLWAAVDGHNLPDLPDWKPPYGDDNGNGRDNGKQ